MIKNDQDSQDDCDARMPDMAPGAFDHLLDEIEKEVVPERLLELALRLQAALAQQRRRREGEGGSTGT